MDLKNTSAEKVLNSVQLNEGDPIYVEVKTKSKNLHKYIGRYIQVEEFKNNCLSKSLYFVTMQSLEMFKNGHTNFIEATVINGTKKIWLLSENDVNQHYQRGMDPEIYKRWIKTTTFHKNTNKKV